MHKRFALSLIVLLVAFAYQQRSHFEAHAQHAREVSQGLLSTKSAAPAFNHEWDTNPINPSVLRGASERALKLIQRSEAEWSNKETCASCHHQLLPQVAFKLAHERSVVFNESQAREVTRTAFAFLQDLDEAVQGYEYIDVLFDGWALTAANLAGLDPNPSMAARAMFVASHQLPDGSWHSTDDRPPQAFGRFTTTAVCAQAIRKYMPETLRAERQSRLARAREWFLKTQPRTTEELTFQLFGLTWTDVGINMRKAAARRLLSEQRNDGGWGQLPALASDAYTTGQVLAALNEAAVIQTTDPAYQRGLRFLLNSQAPDGSWHVQSRLHPPAPVSPPYFETGFPYKHDQFISIMATTWATAALMRAIPPVLAPDKHSKGEGLGTNTRKEPNWVNTVLTGSAADLKKLLDSGMDPEAKTSGGTTALMLSARDPEKVRLLLDRGANPNASAATGITPLMVVSRYRGNAEAVRILLKSGARPNADKGAEVRYDSSALFFALMAGDVETTRLLLDAGARLEKMKILGRFSVSPLLWAVFGSDPGIIEQLIARGVNANEVDDDGMSALAWATVSNNIATLRALLARGAQVNTVDKYGMTPLLYASSIDFGDTDVIEQLIAAGADPTIKNKDGLTALDLANRYNHKTLADVLGKRAARR